MCLLLQTETLANDFVTGSLSKFDHFIVLALACYSCTYTLYMYVQLSSESRFVSLVM